MTRKFLPYWMTPEIMKAAAVMAAMLFVVFLSGGSDVDET
jgi:hypothetical protein